MSHFLKQTTKWLRYLSTPTLATQENVKNNVEKIWDDFLEKFFLSDFCNIFAVAKLEGGRGR